ncbi:MAG: acyl-CoA desaturase [Acidimicrobiales bacterium]
MTRSNGSRTMDDDSSGVSERAGHGTRPSGDRTDWLSAVPFLASHLAPLAALFVTVTWKDWVLCGVLYAVRLFFITAGYHRYFSHRSFKTGRVPQFLLAVGGASAVQKGPLWWAGHHRIHHRFTDIDGDVHSPREGFWWSHVGWILSTRYKATDDSSIRDFLVYPELRLVDRLWWVAPVALAAACLAWGGWGGLFIGFFLSTVLLWHGTFTVNSLAHVVGRRRYATPDTSRNSLPIALLTGGEGWHNNHHYLPSSARQGFTWWEVDPTFYALRGLAVVRVVRDLKRPPPHLLGRARVRDGAFDIGMFRSYWERAAQVTGHALADLTRLQPPTGRDPRGTGGAHDGEDMSAPSAMLAALIRRAMESADQLARATRLTRETIEGAVARDDTLAESTGS